MTSSQSAVGRARQGLLVRWWERRKRRAFPEGAIRFHLSAWAKSRLTPDEVEETRNLLHRWNFEALYVLHGNVLAQPGVGALVLLGPPGVGKSTVSYSLVRNGWAELVEDGLAVVGSRQGQWHVLSTGTTRVLSRASRIGARLRRLTFARRSIFLDADIERSGIRWKMYRIRAWVSFTLAVLLTRDTGRFSPSLLPVARLVVAEHPNVVRPELRIDRGGELQSIRDVSGCVPASVWLLRISSVGEVSEVKERLRRAIVGGAADPVTVAVGS